MTETVTDRDDNLVERRSATFDATRTYRYALERRWSETAPAVFVMLNPSAADAFADDPTIRRCTAFARREGCGGLVVVNLYALRATDPRALYKHAEPVGPENDDILYEAQFQGGPVIAAWGVHGALNSRGVIVAELLLRASDLMCLGLTKGGHPRHPLFVPADKPLALWKERR